MTVEQRAVLSDPDVLAVRASYCAALRRFCPRLADVSQRMLDQICLPGWILEWYLPRWLGDGFGLHPDLSRSLILSNVYGLAYVRLQDDLVDGDLKLESRESAILLASGLYHLWMLEYVRLFESTSRFWGYLDEFMGQWLRATVSSNQPPAVDFSSYQEEDFLRLGERGAPLKICCVGACLLAGREALIPALTVAVDHLLAGTVLLDHAQDWADDVEACRYNAFVAFASTEEQVPPQQQTSHLTLVEEICLGDTARPYFDLVQRHIQMAIEAIRAMDVPGLEQYLHWMESQAASYADRLAAEAKTRLRAVTEQLLGQAMTSDQVATPEEGR
jgi:hypothetical protein